MSAAPNTDPSKQNQIFCIAMRRTTNLTQRPGRTSVCSLCFCLTSGLQTDCSALESQLTTVACARPQQLNCQQCIYCLQVVQEFVGFSIRPWAWCVYLVACVVSCGLLWLLPHYIPQTRLWMMYRCPLSKAQYFQAKVIIC